MKRRFMTLVLVLAAFVATALGLDNSDGVREWLPESGIQQQEGEAI